MLVRPDWRRCHSLQHTANGVAVLIGIYLIGLVPLVIASVVARSAGDAESPFAEIQTETPLLVWVALILVYAPLVEEAMVRWPIARRPRTFLLLPGIYVAIAGITGFGLDLGMRTLADLGAIATSFGLHLLSGRVRVLSAIEHRIDRLWQRWPALPVWLLMICFALAHLVRFDIQWSGPAIGVIPAVVLPWLWFAALASIARIRFGWWAAVTLHAAGNLSIMVLSAVMLSAF